MTDLGPHHFIEFFRDIHQHAPFPWQERLLGRVAQTGRWPALLDLPTGAGKTAALDVALFHLALEADRADRRAPLRVVLVVDRRTIVDQAFRRACAIRDALRHAASPVLRAVRERLASLCGNGEPVRVTMLRGGMVRDDSWARSPDQPLVVVSTVDQVGSRLLFRGYGVSPGMRPIHAGLLGNDALLLLDEVHLSQPFSETLDALATRYRRWAEAPLPDRWQVVRMSATTAPDEHDERFGLDHDDEHHPLLRRRLDARKPAELREVKVSGDDDKRRDTFARACAEAAATHATAPGKAIAVVVNRVQTARDVFARLHGELRGVADVKLVTGRMRPLDRGDLDSELVPRIRAGRARDPGDRSIVVVSTQCIEAGADFDFDVLITECASLDALRQRFGRLNRLGDAGACQGIVLVRSDALREPRDPIYGEALAATWTYLSSLETVDFGLGGPMPAAEQLHDVLAPRLHAPVLLPAHLDTWVQTSPVPDPDPDVSLWLHGPERGEPEVQIVWRAELSKEVLQGALNDEQRLPALLAMIEACAPSSGEALSVPLHAARRWLAKAAGAAEFGDVEGVLLIPDERGEAGDEPRPALAWREASAVVIPGYIRPGDTLVVPAAYGGLSEGTWDPDASAPVRDLGDRACLGQRGRPTLRLHADVVRDALELAPGDALPAWAQPPVPSPDDDPDSDDVAAVIGWLEGVAAEDTAPAWLRRAAEHLLSECRTRRRCRILRLQATDEGSYFALIARRRVADDELVDGEVTTEGDLGSFTGVQVTLREHLAGVAEHAREFARRCGLPEQVISDVALAARGHDAGKADPRFQVLLHGGSLFKAEVAAEPIAKSSTPPGDRDARELARRRSGYPAGCRHEVMSVALLHGHEPFRREATDWDLVLHLVASHHGWCRPLAPVAIDTEPVEVELEVGGVRLHASSDHGLARLDSGICDRFWRLVRKYGWFGLAWLEAVLRLADHRRSELEQRGLTREGL